MYDYSAIDVSKLNDAQQEAMKAKSRNQNRLMVVAFRAQQMANVLYMDGFDAYMQMPSALEELMWEDEEDDGDAWTDADAELELMSLTGSTKHFLLNSLALYRKHADEEEMQAIEKVRSVLASAIGLDHYEKCYARHFQDGDLEKELACGGCMFMPTMIRP